MRGRGEPHARGPSSAVLALGCERVGCAPSAAVRRASQWTTQGQRAEFIPLAASIHVGACAARARCKVRASVCIGRRCCTRQVMQQRRLAEPVMLYTWLKSAWHTLCSIQHRHVMGRRMAGTPIMKQARLRGGYWRCSAQRCSMVRAVPQSKLAASRVKARMAIRDVSRGLRNKAVRRGQRVQGRNRAVVGGGAQGWVGGVCDGRLTHGADGSGAGAKD